MTSILSASCDYLQTHLAITHQNEYILQGFKRKEKDLIQNYDKTLKDQEQQIARLKAEIMQEKGLLLVKQEEVKMVRDNGCERVRELEEIV